MNSFGRACAIGALRGFLVCLLLKELNGLLAGIGGALWFLGDFLTYVDLNDYHKKAGDL